MTPPTKATLERHALDAAKKQLRVGCPKTALVILEIAAESIARAAK